LFWRRAIRWAESILLLMQWRREQCSL
jgi:hypothetical protein